jgi:hypothetical protein
MKKVLLFHMAGCPFCRAADGWIRELTQEYPELGQVEIERIDELKHPDTANRYNYWFVPTFYVDGKKVHEGICSKKIVENVLRSALI